MDDIRQRITIVISKWLVALLVTASPFFSAVGLTQTTPNFGIREKRLELKVFINVHITVSPGKNIENGILIIDKGKVVDVGSRLQIPKTAEVIDLHGAHIYPGFIDPFTDYGITGESIDTPKPSESAPPKYEGTRRGGNAWNDAIRAHIDWVDAFRPDTGISNEFIKQGFTTVQSARLDGVLRGRSFVTLLGEGLPNDLILKASGSHFAAFDKGSSPQLNPSSLMGSIALLRQTFLDSRWYVRARAAYELNPDQRRPEFNAALASLKDVEREKIIFATSNTLSLLRAEKIAEELSLNFIYLGNGHEYVYVDQLKSIGATIISLLDFPDPPRLESVNDDLDITLAQLRHWERAPSNPAVLASRSIDVAFTTHRLKKRKDFLSKVRIAIEHGLPQRQALSALTTVPAEICGLSSLIGSLKPGRLANFIVTDGNIFDSSSTIYSVWIAGRENRLKYLPATDYRGRYSITLNDMSGHLTIEGSISNLKGSIAFGSDTIGLFDVRLEREQLFFSASIDTCNISGISNFQAGKIHDSLFGQCVLANGSRLNWRGVLEPKADLDSPHRGSDPVAPIDYISELTYPNRAFGLSVPPRPQNLLIRNATVWTSDTAGIMLNADVLVKNGKFSAVGHDLQAPDDAVIIDAAGKHVTAGLIDEHSHIAISGGVNEWTDAVTSEVRIGDVVNPEDIAIYRELAGGTTISHLLHGSANPIGGQAQIIKHRWGSNAEDMKFKGARPTIKFALGENVKQSNWGDKYNIRYPQTRMGVESTLRDEFQTAIEYEAAWQNYLTLGRRGQARTVPPRRDLELEAVVQIKNSEMFVHCHSYVQSEILMLMRLAESFGFRIQNFTHILEGYKVADEMAAHGATASAFADAWAYKFEVYDAIPYNVPLMMARGVITSINSDSRERGRRLNTEAAKAVMYGGVSQEEAIKLATINPAIQLKIDDRVGSITVGKDADFVIWNGNPLSLYSSVEQTWIDGRMYFDTESDMVARKQIIREKNALVQKVRTTLKDLPETMNENNNNDSHKIGRRVIDDEWHCDDMTDYWRSQP